MPLLAFYAAVVVINAEVSLCLDTRHTEQHGLHQLTAELHLQDETIKKACASEDQDFTITAALADQAAVDLSKVPSQSLDMAGTDSLCRECMLHPFFAAVSHALLCWRQLKLILGLIEGWISLC